LPFVAAIVVVYMFDAVTACQFVPEPEYCQT
jgi:hypothetical protein